MLQKSIPKSRHFHASLETVFFTIGEPKSTKTRFQNYPKMKPFLESDKATESCSRLHADLVFEVWRVPKSHLFWNHFRKPSSCCTGTLVFQIFDKNDSPESLQNRSKILLKMKTQTKWKNIIKSGRGGSKNLSRRRGRHLWQCGNIAFCSAGGGYSLGFATFQRFQTPVYLQKANWLKSVGF